MNTRKYIFLDLNTQRDFLDADGAFPVANRDAVLEQMRAVFKLAQQYHVPVISALESHRECESAASGLPPHCVEGTPGHKKLSFSLLGNRTLVEADNNLNLPNNLLDSYRQVIFRRRTPDLLDNPKADRLLSEFKTSIYVLFGVGMERSIRRLALSLIAREHHVALVPSACGYWTESDADLACRQLVAKGATELSIEQLQDLLEQATAKRIPRIKKQTRRSTRSRRSMAG